MRQPETATTNRSFELERISTAEILDESAPNTMRGRAPDALKAIFRTKIGKALMFLFGGFHALTALEGNVNAEESGDPEELNVLNLSTIFGTGEEAKLIKRYGPEIKKVLSIDLSKSPGTPGHFIGLHDKFFFRHGADRNIYVHEYDQTENKLPVHTVIQRPNLPPSDSIEDAFVSNGHVFYSTWTKDTKTGYLAIIPLNIKDTNEKRELSAGKAQILSFPDDIPVLSISAEEENHVYLAFATGAKTEKAVVRGFALKDGNWIQDFEKGIDPDCGAIGIFTESDGKKFLASPNNIDGGIWLQSIDNPDEPPIFHPMSELAGATIYDIHQLDGNNVLIGASGPLGDGSTLIQDFSNFLKPPLSYPHGATHCDDLPLSGVTQCDIVSVQSDGNGGYIVTEDWKGPDGTPTIPPDKALDSAAVSKDKDGDGKPDFLDNCPAKANFDQTNKDGDGLGDVCDPDYVPPEPEPAPEEATKVEEATTDASESEPDSESSDAESAPEANKPDALEYETDTGDSSSPETTPEISQEIVDHANETSVAGDEGTKARNRDSNDGSCTPTQNPSAPWYRLALAAALGLLLRRKPKTASE